MMNVHVVTVATHSQGYFPVLEESCKRHNINLTVLGFNQKWGGFFMKFKLIREFLNTKQDDDIIMFIDAFDVIILQNTNIILKRFLKYKTNILISQDDTPNDLIHSYFYYKIFNKCKNTYINSGGYMGYCKYLKQMFNLMCETNDCSLLNGDDQVMLGSLGSQPFFDKHIKIDTKHVIFLNIFPNNSFTTDITFKSKNNKHYC